MYISYHKDNSKCLITKDSIRVNNMKKSVGNKLINYNVMRKLKRKWPCISNTYCPMRKHHWHTAEVNKQTMCSVTSCPCYVKYAQAMMMVSRVWCRMSIIVNMIIKVSKTTKQNTMNNKNAILSIKWCTISVTCKWHWQSKCQRLNILVLMNCAMLMIK